MRQLLHTPETVLDELRADYGPVCRLGAGPLRMAVVCSPALIRELLMQPNERFRYDTPLSPFPFVIGGRSMLVSDGHDHKRRRGSVQAAFSRRRLNTWIPMIVERTDAAIDELLVNRSGEDPVDLYPVGRRLIIEIVVRAMFGERLVGHTAEIDVGFRRIQAYLSAPLYRQVPHPFPFTMRAGVRADRKALDRLIDVEIAASRRNPRRADRMVATDESDSVDRLDVLDALVHHSDLDDAEIRDQIKTLIGAGYDTTASSLAWMLWEATLHSGLWDRLGAEADTVLGAPGGSAAPDDRSLAALTLADATMRETLRLHPASGVAVRQAAVDLTLGGFTIAAGTLVIWSPYLAGRDPALWPDHTRFSPERWVDADDAQRAAADIGWVPFGRGPRSCIGFALAQMEMTLIIARLAQRLDITACAPSVPAARGLVVSQAIGGAPMHVARRHVSCRAEG
jgi:cytochrome P450